MNRGLPEPNITASASIQEGVNYFPLNTAQFPSGPGTVLQAGVGRRRRSVYADLTGRSRLM